MGRRLGTQFRIDVLLLIFSMIMKKNILHNIIFTLSLMSGSLMLGNMLSSCADEADTENLVLSGEYLSLETRNVTLEGGGSSHTIAIDANCEWKVSDVAEWLTASPTSGNGSGSLTLSAQANSSVNAERTANISIVSSGGLRRSIHVVQNRNQELLAFNVDELAFPAEGDTKTLTINSNVSWTLQGAEEWFSLSATQGKGTADIIITARPNTSEASRQAVLTLKGTTLTTRVTISQEGEQRAITPSVTSMTFDAVGATKTFTLDGTAAWTASSSAEWLKLTPLSGTGAATLYATCTDNIAQSQRTAKITITLTSSGYTQTVDVLQQAAQLPALANIQIVSIERTSATLAAQVSSAFDITEYGFCYSAVSETPLTSDGHVQASSRDADGTYTASLSNLQSGTTYYVRAYARSIVGTGYGNVMKVTTSGGKPGEDDNPKPNI